jgi:tetratricopeptide (TPR) repeat protein
MADPIRKPASGRRGEAPAPAGRPSKSSPLPKAAPRPAASRPVPGRAVPAPPRSRPAAESPDAAPPGKASSKKPLILALAGGGAGLVLVIAVAVATSGGPSRRREEPAPAPPVAVTPAPKPKPRTGLPDPPPKSTADVEEEMKRKIEEDKRKFLEDEKRRTEEARRKAAEEKARKEAEAREKADAEATRKKEAVAGYETRKRERKAQSLKALEDARREIEEDRRAEAARQKALVEKLKNLKLSLQLKNGLKLDHVVVQGMTRDEIKLAFQFEGASAEQAFPIEFIHDKSYVELLKAIHKDGGAAGLYEMGRHLVLRKLWKDAQAVFQECVKQDSAYQTRVPDLTRILNNEAAFKGTARRIGADQLLIQYDFSDAAMAQDFQMRQAGQLAIEGGELKLTARGTALWSLKDVDFDRELEVDLVAILDEGASLVLGSFFTWDQKGYLAVLNSKTPAGHVLYRREAQKLDGLATQAEPKIPPSVETRVRFTVRGGAFRVYAGEKEILAASDGTTPKGWFTLGAASGSVRVKKLTVQGRVNPAEIDKRFAEVEVLVRRALEADLGKKKKADEEDVDPLSGEDEFFAGALDPAVKSDFEKARKAVVQAVQKRRLLPNHLTMFDGLIGKAPDFAPLYYWRGIARLAFRRAEEAKADFAKAIELNADFFEAHYGMAQAALEERDLGASAAAARKALELAPGFPDAQAMAGFLKFLAGDAKGAVADLEVARKLEPGNDYVAQTQKNVLNVIKGPQHLGAKYVKEFPHYVVMTDMSAEKTMLYGTRLEAAYKYYAEAFKDAFREDPRRPKPRVAIFNTREAYLTYGELTLSGRQEWTLGYFHPLYKELLLFEDVDHEATLQTLYHEAFHQFMSMMVPKAPYWYNEGIAEFMGGIKVEVGKAGQSKIVERARVLEGRLKALKMALPMALKFQDIMLQTPSQFYSGPVSFKYAQAWSMVHFFYEHEQGKYRPRIENYFKKLKDGGDPKAAFDAGFGDADPEALQKEWLEYVKKLEPAKK